MFVLIKSQTSSKMGHVRLKTRSLGQILEKPCVHSKGQIFSPIFITLGQNVCLYEILNKFEKGVMSDQKLGQVLEKPCVGSRGHIFSPIIMKYC